MVIALIEKYNKSNFFWKRLNERRPELLQTIRKYDGFEGNCVSCIGDDQINISSIQELKQEYLDKSKVREDRSYILICISENEEIKSEVQENFIFIGYDCGFFKDDSNIYSSVLNEVIWGKREKLTEYERELNQSYLFPTKEDAFYYLNYHQELKKKGEDVEDDEDMSVFKVWKFTQ